MFHLSDVSDVSDTEEFTVKSNPIRFDNVLVPINVDNALFSSELMQIFSESKLTQILYDYFESKITLNNSIDMFHGMTSNISCLIDTQTYSNNKKEYYINSDGEEDYYLDQSKEYGEAVSANFHAEHIPITELSIETEFLSELQYLFCELELTRVLLEYHANFDLYYKVTSVMMQECHDDDDSGPEGDSIFEEYIEPQLDKLCYSKFNKMYIYGNCISIYIGFNLVMVILGLTEYRIINSDIRKYFIPYIKNNIQLLVLSYILKECETNMNYELDNGWKHDEFELEEKKIAMDLDIQRATIMRDKVQHYLNKLQIN